MATKYINLMTTRGLTKPNVLQCEHPNLDVYWSGYHAPPPPPLTRPL